jgi:hypothetical protein
VLFEQGGVSVQPERTLGGDQQDGGVGLAQHPSASVTGRGADTDALLDALRSGLGRGLKRQRGGGELRRVGGLAPGHQELALDVEDTRQTIPSGLRVQRRCARLLQHEAVPAPGKFEHLIGLADLYHIHLVSAEAEEGTVHQRACRLPERP